MKHFSFHGSILLKSEFSTEKALVFKQFQLVIHVIIFTFRLLSPFYRWEIEAQRVNDLPESVRKPVSAKKEPGSLASASASSHLYTRCKDGLL